MSIKQFVTLHNTITFVQFLDLLEIVWGDADFLDLLHSDDIAKVSRCHFDECIAHNGTSFNHERFC